MPDTLLRLRDSTSYKNYTDKHDAYEYLVSLKKEFYLKNEYDIERGVIDLMHSDDLVNDRVYKKLHQDVNDKAYKARCNKKMYILFAFYMLLFAYIYLTRH
jgi:hypothetical protein